jgi:hypothetical protein
MLNDEQADQFMAQMLMNDYQSIKNGEWSEDCKRFLPAYELLFESYLTQKQIWEIKQ